MSRRKWNNKRKPDSSSALSISGRPARFFGCEHKTVSFGHPAVRTDRDMSQDELAAIAQEYGCDVLAARFEFGLA